MARFPSIGKQVNDILQRHNGIRESKKEARENSGIKSVESGQKVSNEFHSYKSLDNARADLTNLGKFAKSEHGIKDMSQINAEIVKDWINKKDISYNTASNYLSEINKVHEQLNITREEVKEARSQFKETLSKPQLETRAYRNLERVVVAERSKPAFELQRDYGLRAGAATHINIEKQIKGNTLSFQEKGGKWSTRELKPDLVKEIQQKSKDGIYAINSKTYSRDLKVAIERVGNKYNGTHGLRHTYVHNRAEQGASPQEISQELGHNREDVVTVYQR
ncbi:MAG: hypothetical protein U9O87_02175 [Verrucomicrobiota bacterium]|nr:hypothetical protein [Verrucomicrobiota bacterium]